MLWGNDYDVPDEEEDLDEEEQDQQDFWQEYNDEISHEYDR